MLRSRKKRTNKASKRKRNTRQNYQQIMLRSTLVATSIALCILTCSLFNHVLATGFFTIKHITVSGCMHFKNHEIINIAGIKKGGNILFADMKNKIRKLEENPWINKAVIKVKLPDTITIALKERKPAAVIKVDGFYFVDTNGEIFKKIKEPLQTLPLLAGLSREDFNKHPRQSLRIINCAVQLIEKMQEKNMPTGMDTTIQMDRIFGLKLHRSEDKMEVLLGFDLFSKKLVILDKIIKDLSTKELCATSINLNSLKKAYVKVDNHKARKRS